ncbi:hypothetical protein J45TS6_38000 [Paenibacillus sp. J45TS6]|uniref:hypothetical protein n=1 Tax=Paenibacillus sp. J45TS6 TaxID=2807196 RepID=UPI001B20509F|nr:hypothetical protein [Paenibacillus sp. J45TS6]GIP45341.1 hypothetical protein J45TS6_38000 [Paenibacillus sp. J45TS6]
MGKTVSIWTITGSIFLIILFAVLIGREYDKQEQQQINGKAFTYSYGLTASSLRASTYYTDTVLNRAGALNRDSARELFLGYTRLIRAAEEIRQLRSNHFEVEELSTEALENKLKELGVELLSHSSKILEGTGDRRELKKTRMVIHELQEQIPDLPSDTNYKDFPEEQKKELIHLLNRISAQLEKGRGGT